MNHLAANCRTDGKLTDQLAVMRVGAPNTTQVPRHRRSERIPGHTRHIRRDRRAGGANETILVALDLLYSNVCTALSWLRTGTSDDHTPPATPDTPSTVDPRTTAEMAGPVRHAVQRRPGKVADIDVDALLARHHAGCSLRQLAVEFGIHRTTLSGLLRTAGVETDRFVVPPATVKQIIHMYKNGSSCITISKRVGRAKSTVRAVLVRNGVRMRDSHGREQ